MTPTLIAPPPSPLQAPSVSSLAANNIVSFSRAPVVLGSATTSGAAFGGAMVGVAAGSVTAVALELAFPRSVADGTRTGAETRLQQEALKAIRGRGDAKLSPLERQLKSALAEAHQAFPGQKFQVVQGFDHQGQTVLALRRGETTIPLMMGASVISNPTISVPESGARVSSTAKVRDERLEQIREDQLERHAREDQARSQRQVTASWSGSAKADLLRAYGSMKGQFEMATPPTIRLKGVDTNQNGRSDRFSVESAEAAIARSYESAAQHSFKFNRDATPNGNRMVAFRHPEGPLAPVLVYTGTRAEIARLARDGVVSAQELARAGLGAASLRPGSAKAAQPSPPPDLRTTVTDPRPTPTSTPSTTLQNPGENPEVGSRRELLLRPLKNILLPGGSCTSTSPFTVRGFPNGQNAADNSCRTDTLPISPVQAHSTTPSKSTGGVRPLPLHESPQRAGEAQPFQGPTASASAVGGGAVATSDSPSQASGRPSSGANSRQSEQRWPANQQSLVIAGQDMLTTLKSMQIAITDPSSFESESAKLRAQPVDPSVMRRAIDMTYREVKEKLAALGRSTVANQSEVSGYTQQLEKLEVLASRLGVKSPSQLRPHRIEISMKNSYSVGRVHFQRPGRTDAVVPYSDNNVTHDILSHTHVPALLQQAGVVLPKVVTVVDEILAGAIDIVPDIEEAQKNKWLDEFNSVEMNNPLPLPLRASQQPGDKVEQQLALMYSDLGRRIEHTTISLCLALEKAGLINFEDTRFGNNYLKGVIGEPESRVGLEFVYDSGDMLGSLDQAARTQIESMVQRLNELLRLAEISVRDKEQINPWLRANMAIRELFTR